MSEVTKKIPHTQVFVGFFGLEGMILLFNCLDYFGGIAGSDGVSGNVVRDNRTGSYGTIIADGDSRQDGHIAAYPDIITDGHRFRPFLTSFAFTRVGTMARAVDMHARSQETIVAYGHIGLVQDGKAEVRKETLAHTDMLAVVAIEGLVDEGVFIRLAQDLADHFVARRKVRRQQVVVLLTKHFYAVEVFQQLRVTGVVYFACQHFLPFCAHFFLVYLALTISYELRMRSRVKSSGEECGSKPIQCLGDSTFIYKPDMFTK